MNAIDAYVHRRLQDPSEHGRNKAEHHLFKDSQDAWGDYGYRFAGATWHITLSTAEAEHANVLALERLLANTMMDVPAPPRLALFSALNPSQYHHIIEGDIIALDDHGQMVTFAQEVQE